MSGFMWFLIHRGGPRWPAAAAWRRAWALGGLAFVAVALTPWGPPATWPFVADAADLSGIHKIQHIVVIMQENRSFDHHFGTFPGADGIPMQHGVPTVCVTDPRSGRCVKPFHDPHDLNRGGPHSAKNAVADINGGKMDGFIGQVGGRRGRCVGAFDPNCGGGAGEPDVMGYHDAREIPNYWTYAREFVLQDRMFEPNASWSLPEHLFMVSEWSAKCSQPGNPMSCQNALQNPTSLGQGRKQGLVKRPDYAWTDLTYLLHKANVSWAYYV